MPARKPFNLGNLPKGCTQEKAKQIDEWVTKCWRSHWKEYGPSSNYRTTLLDYALRDHKDLDDAEMTRIYNAVVAQTEYFRKKAAAGDSVKGKGLGVWYNQGIYNEEFIDESSVSLKERAQKKLANCSKCNQKVHGEKYDLCTDCLLREHEDPELRNRRILALKELGLLDEKSTYQDVIQACKDRGSVNSNFSLIHLMRVSNVQENKKS